MTSIGPRATGGRGELRRFHASRTKIEEASVAILFVQVGAGQLSQAQFGGGLSIVPTSDPPRARVTSVARLSEARSSDREGNCAKMRRENKRWMSRSV